MIKVVAEKEVTEEDVNAEIEAFQEAFIKMGNPPLISVERSILKTYLIWNLRYRNGQVEPKA